MLDKVKIGEHFVSSAGRLVDNGGRPLNKAFPNTESWKGRWAVVQTSLQNLNWSSAWRRNLTMMEGIQTHDKSFAIHHQWCVAAGVPKHTFEDSHLGNPEGRLIDGIFCTAQSLRQAYHAHNALATFTHDEPTNFLEIGAGFGSLARVVMTHYAKPGDKYYFVDSVPMQQLQLGYLQRTVDGAESTCFAVGAQWPEKVHVVFNINSLGEMTQKQVDEYFSLIQTHMVPGGRFYSSNRIYRGVCFMDYPFDSDWTHALSLNGRFIESVSTRTPGALSPHPWMLLVNERLST